MASSRILNFNTLWRGQGGAGIMIFLDFIVGAATGVLSGFGIGGGTLLVLYLTAVGGIEQTIAGGINLLYFIGCAPADNPKVMIYVVVDEAADEELQSRASIASTLAADIWKRLCRILRFIRIRRFSIRTLSLTKRM